MPKEWGVTLKIKFLNSLSEFPSCILRHVLKGRSTELY
jgi:hypothetical protein